MLLIKKLASVLICAAMLSFTAGAQNITVSGKVSDKSGEPIPGAFVKVQNTTTGTTTDIDGNYSISTKSDATLEVSFLGFVTETAAIAGRNKIDFTLLEDSESLDALVVIGYGTARKSDITGSIASVGGNDLREVPANDITHALAGRVAGVEMRATSSKPGSSMTIRIRGERSISASNDPLIVLDGVPFMGSLSEISTNDIKSIDILKDAASTAIYGSRGANGVIMISTYKGIEGQEPTISFKAYASINKPFKYRMMSGEKYVTMRKMAAVYENSIDESDDAYVDWQDLMYEDGVTQNYEVSIAGGTKGGAYRFGVSYYDDKAVVPTQKYNRLSVNGSIDQNIGKWFKVGFQNYTQYGANTGNQVGVQYQMSPILNIYNDDGSTKLRVDMPSDNGWYVWTKERVYEYTNKGIYNSESNTMSTYNNAYLQFNVPGVQGLSFKVTGSFNYRRNRGGSFTGQGIGASADDSPNSASWSFSETLNWTVENLLTYDRTFGKHKINAVALYSAEQTTSQGQSLSGKNIPNEQFQWYNIGACLASDITVNNGSYTQTGLMSWMARAMYSYDDRYMLSVAVRSDASSRLAEGHKWHTYPAFSAGWNIHNEQFMSSTRGWLDELKLRVGYGVTSNQAVAAYSTLGSLSTKVYNYGDEKYATGYYVSTLPNSELGWEYSNTWNFGLDFGFFKGRLRGTIEYYTVKTNDILLGLSLPATTGVGSTTANIGSTQNKGIEFSVNGTIIEQGDWKWDLGLNIYANRNKLTALADGSEADKSNGWFVGYPLNCIYDYEYDGLWNEGDPYMDILEPSTVDAKTGYKRSIGMIKVKYHGDYNENGEPTRAINSNDKVPYSAEPIFNGGFNTRLSWRNFDLSIIGDYQAGGIFVSSLHQGYENLLTGRRGQIDVDYWTPDNTTARYPRPGSTRSTDSPKYASLMGYFDGTYIKVNNITLGYSFQKLDCFKKAGINNCRLYATVTNPFTIYSQFTKETGLLQQGNTSGSHRSSLSASTPYTRNFLIGIDLSF